MQNTSSTLEFIDRSSAEKKKKKLNSARSSFFFLSKKYLNWITIQVKNLSIPKHVYQNSTYVKYDSCGTKTTEIETKKKPRELKLGKTKILSVLRYVFKPPTHEKIKAYVSQIAH